MVDQQVAVIRKLKEIVSSRLGLDLDQDQIGTDDRLASQVGVDSIGFIELKFQCEEEFSIEITEDEFDPKYFTSCESLSGLIVNKLEAAGS